MEPTTSAAYLTVEFKSTAAIWVRGVITSLATLLAEVHDQLDHLACVLLENPFFLPCVDEGLDLLLRGLLFLGGFDVFFPALKVLQG